MRNRRVLPHARRFKHDRMKLAIDWSGIDPGDLYQFAYLYQQSDMNTEAEDIYLRALAGKEKAWGPEHTSTLDTVNNLGALYSDQSKMKEAEDMCLRALAGYEKAWGPEHKQTLDTRYNLGLLYKIRSIKVPINL